MGLDFSYSLPSFQCLNHLATSLPYTKFIQETLPPTSKSIDNVEWSVYSFSHHFTMYEQWDLKFCTNMNRKLNNSISTGIFGRTTVPLLQKDIISSQIKLSRFLITKHWNCDSYKMYPLMKFNKYHLLTHTRKYTIRCKQDPSIKTVG